MVSQDKALRGAAPGGQQSRGSLDLTRLIPGSFHFTLCKAHLFYPPEPDDNPKHKDCGSCQTHMSFGHVVLDSHSPEAADPPLRLRERQTRSLSITWGT